MKTVKDLQAEIIKLKEEKNIAILAHSYQAREIIEVADCTGDSFALSVAATKVAQDTVLMCGVRFMAETVKLLSPQKKVWLANPDAGCPMAEQMDPEMIAAVKEQYPNHIVVAYVNTTAEQKVLCDVCVTSSSAVNIVRKLDAQNIIFIPDQNLGDYVAKQAPEKNIKLLHGGCPVHAFVNMRDINEARAKHPTALMLVHPECTPDVVAAADFVGSTSAIMDYAIASDHNEFLIGTEISIVENLQFACPDKNFWPVTNKLICPNMKITTLVDVWRCVSGGGGEEIVLADNVLKDARKCIDKMIELG